MGKGCTHKIIPTSSRNFIKVLKKFGFKEKPLNGGSHIKLTKDGISRPVVVASHGNQDIRSFDIKSSLKTAEISEEEYLAAFNSL